MIHQEEVGEADDRRQHVVEVMRDAAGELADGLHLLALGDLHFERPLLGGVDGVGDGRLAFTLSPLDGAEIDAPAPLLVVLKGDVDRLDHALPGNCRVERLAQRIGTVGVGEARERHLARRHAIDGASEQPHEGGVGGADGALAVDGGDGDGGGVEQPGKAKLGGGGLLRASGRAVEHQRMGEGAVARQAMQDAHGKRGAVGLDEIDVETPCVALGSAAAGPGNERSPVFRHDLGELELASRDIAKVEAEPLGERGIEIVDGAVAVGGEETGRRVVEIGDRLLDLLEAGFLPFAVRGHLVDLPDHEAAFAASPRLGWHWLHRDAEPARADGRIFIGFAERRQAELFAERPALLGCARQAEDLLGEIGAAGKGAIGRLHHHARLKPEQIAVRLVGVEHAAALVGDQGTLRQIVDEGLGDVVARLVLPEMQDADGAGEQAKHADHGKSAENGKDEGLGHFARDHGKRDGGHGKAKGKRHHETDIALAARLIGGRLGVSRWSVDVGHGAKLSDSISLRAAHCGVAHGCS